jgi:hypothetical protein
VRKWSASVAIKFLKLLACCKTRKGDDYSSKLLPLAWVDGFKGQSENPRAGQHIHLLLRDFMSFSENLNISIIMFCLVLFICIVSLAFCSFRIIVISSATCRNCIIKWTAKTVNGEMQKNWPMEQAN